VQCPTSGSPITLHLFASRPSGLAIFRLIPSSWITTVSEDSSKLTGSCMILTAPQLLAILSWAGPSSCQGGTLKKSTTTRLSWTSLMIPSCGVLTRSPTGHTQTMRQITLRIFIMTFMCALLASASHELTGTYSMGKSPTKPRILVFHASSLARCSNIGFSNSSGWLLPANFSVGAGPNNWYGS
jgi:hypothetical protein